MKFIKTYQNIWIQSIVFFLIGVFKHQTVFICLSVVLLLLPFISEKGALKYMHFLEKLLNKIGYWLKNLLFFLLYYVVFSGVALIRKFSPQENSKRFTSRNKTFSPADFEKMW